VTARDARGDDELPAYLARDTVALLTPIRNGNVLAAICALNGAKCDVIEVPQGTFAVLVDDSEGAGDRAAMAVTALHREIVLLAMERRGGQVTVTRWARGERGADVPPGLALDQAPGGVQRLMLGAATIEDLLAEDPSKVYRGRTGRFRAFWRLRRLASQAKRERQA
jgi:hypothetical protein